MGSAAAECLEQLERKALDAVMVDQVNERLASIWPDLKRELRQFIIPVDEMERLLSDAGAPTTAADLGLDLEFYRQAVRHGHEMRDRFSFVDIAANADMLEPYVASQT
jgi:glycerol-1-phosphate dehydrogenase [NAD(P)+]